MKRIMAGIFFVMIIFNVSAENIFDFCWGFGNIGLGMNYSSENNDNIEFTVSIINITFEHKDTNIGIEINPIKYWYLFEFQNEPETTENGGKFSFINTNIYWDLIENYSILLGPFMSINYMFINTSTGLNMNEYIFSGGLRFSFKLKDIRYPENYNSQIISSEIGYRNIMGKNKLYFSINVDIILALMGISDGMKYSQKY
ncbi:MAG: hypothetical protein LBH43_14270 [Treponema sp.]|jgi:hypothetical protein|nr:hypothetical protein [Treponema sp.]